MKNSIQIIFASLVLKIGIFLPVIAQTNLPQGLIAYYPFNGNANDISGNNLNGVVTGATLTSDRNSSLNSAYDFDFANAIFGQQNDEVFIPYNPILNVTNITVSVWLYPREYYWNGNSDQYSIIINRYQHGYSNPSGEAWGIVFNQTLITGFIMSDINGIATSNTPLQLNMWHHIVMTYDLNQLKLYVDGTLVATQSYSRPMNILGNSGISIGESNQANGYWNHTNGKIDDVGIWNRALAYNEIQKLYMEGINSKSVVHNNAKSILITPELIQSNSTITGIGNTFMGENALKNNRNGSYNTAIGFQSGGMTSGTGNIFVGANAGNLTDFQSASNKLIIANSNTNSPLIYGEFDNSILKINGKLVLQKNNGVPINSNSQGLQGQIAFDDNYLYICIQTNVWKRFALSSW